MKVLMASCSEPLLASLESLRGVTLEQARTGEDFLELAEIYKYDLAVVTSDLPDTGCLALVERLRRQGSRMPLLAVLGTHGHEPRVAALRAGADDALSSPFHRDELEERMRALHRRTHGTAVSIIRIGLMELDMERKSVRVDGSHVHMSSKEYEILEMLALRPGSVISKGAILSQIYCGMDEPEIKTIDVFICKIRKKLGPAREILSTVWGRGYMVR